MAELIPVQTATNRYFRELAKVGPANQIVDDFGASQRSWATPPDKPPLFFTSRDEQRLAAFCGPDLYVLRLDEADARDLGEGWRAGHYWVDRRPNP